jgi:hypothetical protein
MHLPSLRLTPNRRFFQTTDGKPFFYLADTAWELFHRATREEAELLLADRAKKGFNVIQAVALAEFDGLHTPNAYGHCPLRDDDPTQPVEEYWQHVDWVTRRANELGLYMAMLPTWGDKWSRNNWGIGPQIFTPKNARLYAEWLSRRYRDYDLVWITGGDRPVRDQDDLDLINAFAAGLKVGASERVLMTLHPPGGSSSSKYVHTETWLDFHMTQTGHDRNSPSWYALERDWDLLPARPVVNGEPIYEGHPNAFQSGDSGWTDHNDIRRDLFWAICEGAAGFTYGCHSIWQFWDEKREPLNVPRVYWREALDLPGASQMNIGKRLVLSRPFTERQPASGRLVSPQGTPVEAIRACRGADGSWMIAYLPLGQRARINGTNLTGDRLHVRWLNPRTGQVTDGGERDRAPEMHCTPPYDPHGRDWVLLIDDVTRAYPNP